MNLQEIKGKLEGVAELLYVNNRVLDEYFDVLGESETTIGVGSDKVVPQGLSAEIDDLLAIIVTRCEVNSKYVGRVKQSVVPKSVVTDLEANVGWSHKAARAGNNQCGNLSSRDKAGLESAAEVKSYYNHYFASEPDMQRENLNSVVNLSRDVI